LLLLITLYIFSIPFLESEPLDIMETMTCRDAMATDVVCFRALEKVSIILHALKTTHHNGFPVVAIGVCGGNNKFKGVILRRHLLLLIKYKHYISSKSDNLNRLTYGEFRNLLNGPRVSASNILLSDVDLNAEVECWYYMNCSAVTVHQEMNLALAFRLFRTLGLRHLPVLDDENNVVGIITRQRLLHEICEKKHKELEEEEHHKLSDNKGDV